MMRTVLAGLACLLPACLLADERLATPRFVYPAAQQGAAAWQRRAPAEAGLDPALIGKLEGTADRWALWRDGYLVHVAGDFDQKQDVASLRKTWHALTVGAALGQRKIQSLDEPIDRFHPDLTGEDTKATWRHVITQSSAFDYPYADWPDYAPGRI